MKVLFLSYEVAPILKFGGLGDVAGSLPRALHRLGVDVRIGMPGYRTIKKPSHLPGSIIPMLYAYDELFKDLLIHKKFNPHLVSVGYALFARLILEEAKKNKFCPDIIHLNDWHTSLVSLWLEHLKDPFFANTKTILTIHNTAYQGVFPIKHMYDHHYSAELMTRMQKRKNDTVSFLENGILSADWITTVSPHFADELTAGKNDFNLHKALYTRRKQFSGILNGIDYNLFNRESDRYINAAYGVEDVAEGKQKNKVWLQNKLKLKANPACALFGVVSRLDKQKGFDILVPIMQRLVKKDVQFIIQGKGDPAITKLLEKAAHKYKGSIVFTNEFDEELAHQTYAASDFFLIPSVFEPCGLTQMIAMTYGAIPIAANVGGLHDTITDGQTGFLFKHHTVADFFEACERALDYWHDPVALHFIRQRCLKQDFSWDKSAKEYLRLYKKVFRNN